MSSLDSVFRLIVNHCHRIWSLTRAKGLDTLYFHRGGMATAVGAAHFSALPNKKIINRFGKQGENKSDSRIGLQELSNLIFVSPLQENQSSS
ncbi:MAG: hypothetical protein V7K40_16940 [Nostoc sp.]